MTLWFGSFLLSRQYPLGGVLPWVARMGWMMFFPLWFVLATPILRAKTGMADESGFRPSDSVRIAGLVNRARKSPLRRSHWWMFALAAIAGLAAISARALGAPFENDGLQRAWLMQLAGYASQVLLIAAILPWVLRRMLLEPEPLDAAGNPDLAQMYDSLRDAKILGLFWMLGIAMPLVFATAFSVMCWTGIGEYAAWIGAIGGSCIGIAGAGFGVVMGMRRMRIAEFKRDLDRQARANSSGPS